MLRRVRRGWTGEFTHHTELLRLIAASALHVVVKRNADGFGTRASTRRLSAALETVSAVIARLTIPVKRTNFVNFMLGFCRMRVCPAGTPLLNLERLGVPVVPLNPIAVPGYKVYHSRRHSLRK